MTSFRYGKADFAVDISEREPQITEAEELSNDGHFLSAKYINVPNEGYEATMNGRLGSNAKAM